MNVHDSPIGVFDSGLGGLSVAIEVRRRLPFERLVYAADSSFCPYGDRSPDEIQWRSTLLAGALIARGAKILIVACNTATAVVLEELRATFDVPIIGLEPAVKPAIELTRSARIGVLATPRTAASDRLQRLISRYAMDLEVLVVPGHGLVELVEAGTTSDDVAQAALRPLIEPLLTAGVDTLVLGCTHYPFLKCAIRAVAGPELTLVDSGEAIGRRAEQLLDENDARAQRAIPGGIELLTTGDADHVSRVAARLLGEPIVAEWLPLPTERVRHVPPTDESRKLSPAWTDSVSGGA